MKLKAEFHIQYIYIYSTFISTYLLAVARCNDKLVSFGSCERKRFPLHYSWGVGAMAINFVKYDSYC